MKIWRTLAAVCMIAALALTFAACGNTPANDPSSNPTGETGLEIEPSYALVDPATFKAFVGTWYADGSSASFRIIIKEDASWELLDANQDSLFSGTLSVSEDNKSISLNDPDGMQALGLQLEEDGKVYVEVFVESLMDTLSTNYFFNTVTNDEVDITPIGDGDVVEVSPTEEPIA